MPVRPALPVEAAVQGRQDAPMDPAAVQSAGAPAAHAEREPKLAARAREIPTLPSLAEQQARALTHFPGRSGARFEGKPRPQTTSTCAITEKASKTRSRWTTSSSVP